MVVELFSTLTSYIVRNKNFLLLLPVFVFLPIFFHAVADIALRKRLRVIASAGTRLSALGISATCALGVFGFSLFALCHIMTSPAKHPIMYPVSLTLMALSIILFLMLICLYIFLRVKKGSMLGVIIDVTLALVYSPAFFFIYLLTYDLTARIYKCFG